MSFTCNTFLSIWGQDICQQPSANRGLKWADKLPVASDRDRLWWVEPSTSQSELIAAKQLCCIEKRCGETGNKLRSFHSFWKRVVEFVMNVCPLFRCNFFMKLYSYLEEAEVTWTFLGCPDGLDQMGTAAFWLHPVGVQIHVWESWDNYSK